MRRNDLPVTVITVNYSSSEYISAMLSSIDEDINCILVDNYSNVVEREKVDSLGSEAVSVVHNKNSGFAGGVNVGHSAARDDQWILLANPDVTFAPGAIGTLVREAIEHNIDLAVPQILHADTKNVWFNGGRITTCDFTAVHEGINQPRQIYYGVSDTQFVSGCVVLVSPRGREALFPLDETLFMYYEDVLMSLNAKHLGLRAAVVHAATAMHSEGGTSRGNEAGHSNLFYYYQCRNRLLAAGKVSKPIWIRALVSTPYFYARLVWRIARDDGDAFRKLRSASLGIWDGLLGRDGRTPRKLG